MTGFVVLSILVVLLLVEGYFWPVRTCRVCRGPTRHDDSAPTRHDDSAPTAPDANREVGALHVS